MNINVNRFLLVTLIGTWLLFFLAVMFLEFQKKNEQPPIGQVTGIHFETHFGKDNQPEPEEEIRFTSATIEGYVGVAPRETWEHVGMTYVFYPEEEKRFAALEARVAELEGLLDNITKALRASGCAAGANFRIESRRRRENKRMGDSE